MTDLAAWEGRPPAELIPYLLRHHHANTRRLLAAIAGLLENLKILDATVLPDWFPKLAKLTHALHDDLLAHLPIEETQLFPALLDGNLATETAHALIDRLMREHHRDGMLLFQLETLTQRYQVPADAPPALAELLALLAELQSDLHQHMYLENTQLFPQALNPPC